MLNVLLSNLVVSPKALCNKINKLYLIFLESLIWTAESRILLCNKIILFLKFFIDIKLSNVLFVQASVSTGNIFVHRHKAAHGFTCTARKSISYKKYKDKLNNCTWNTFYKPAFCSFNTGKNQSNAWRTKPVCNNHKNKIDCSDNKRKTAVIVKTTQKRSKGKRNCYNNYTLHSKQEHKHWNADKTCIHGKYLNWFFWTAV